MTETFSGLHLKRKYLKVKKRVMIIRAGKLKMILGYTTASRVEQTSNLGSAIVSLISTLNVIPTLVYQFSTCCDYRRYVIWPIGQSYLTWHVVVHWLLHIGAGLSNLYTEFLVTFIPFVK